MEIQIETKYNLGSKIYCLCREIYTYTIIEIITTSNTNSMGYSCNISYRLRKEGNDGITITKSEKEIDKEFYKSKKDIIKQLMDEV